MKLTALQAAVGSALLLQPALATSAHRHAHNQYGRRHQHSHNANEALQTPNLEKRASCALPTDPDLVAVPGASNNGFAMSSDQPCLDGQYCPIACVPGKVMAQWKDHTSYVYPESMYGGLYCDGGTAKKPFPSSPYCVDGTGTVKAVNTCGKNVAFCQTVLPGNEEMLIPTDVSGERVLAVPGPSYWDSTAAHYYINAPGVSVSDGCKWGSSSVPVGNWAPYVAGANTDSSGQTFVKIAWNPIFIDSPLVNTKPTFGLKIECPGGGCNGLPCSIDPTTDGLGVNSPVSTVGVGGASFCVVTVPKGKSANIVVFNTDGSTGTTTSSSSSSSTSSSTTSKSSSTSSTSTSSTKSSSSLSSSSTATSTTLLPAIFHENATISSSNQPSRSPSTTLSSPSSSVTDAPATTTSSKNEGRATDRGSAAFLGLIVAFVGAAALY